MKRAAVILVAIALCAAPPLSAQRIQRRVYVAAIQIRGDMLAAEPLVLEWLKDAEERDDREGTVTHLLGLAYCYLSRDQPERIPPLLERSRQLLGSEHSGSFNLAWIEALALCYAGAQAPALCDVLGQSQPAVSHHLALLRVAGLIECRRDGKHNFYRALPERVKCLLDVVFDGMPEASRRIRLEDYVLMYSPPAGS